MRAGEIGLLLFMILKFYEDSTGRLITLIDVELEGVAAALLKEALLIKAQSLLRAPRRRRKSRSFLIFFYLLTVCNWFI